MDRNPTATSVLTPVHFQIKFYLRWLVFFLLLSPARAEKPVAKPKSEEKSGWVFSLLPKSLQKNPNLDLTVITEMSEVGKQRPAASAANPVYYVLQTMGYKALGELWGNENKVPAADVERVLEKALTAAGYRPAKPPEHPPTLAIFYVWGSHNLIDRTAADDSTLSGEMVMRNVLDRAQLVGGEKFAKKLLELFAEADALSGASRGSDPVLGAAQQAFLNPVARFKQLDPKNEFLVDQAVSNCFYAVASAYDYEALTQNQRILLWRTRMTANSAGVSQEQSLPTLITAASPFFGREMEGPEILVRRPVREGQVEIGTPTVVPPAATKREEKK